jgi:hypothetical protein
VPTHGDVSKRKNTICNRIGVTDDWRVGCSPTGWVTAESLTNILDMFFAPHLGKCNIKFPLILYVYGHRTHLTFKLSELCYEWGINLISLYPNTTRLLQTLEVATFRPMKLCWKTVILQWHRQNSDKMSIKGWCAPVLDGALNKRSPDCLAIYGFRACGLYPWNPENMTYEIALEKN